MSGGTPSAATAGGTGGAPTAATRSLASTSSVIDRTQHPSANGGGGTVGTSAESEASAGEGMPGTVAGTGAATVRWGR